MIVKGRWWYDITRTQLVPEGDEAAAFLAYPAGEDVSQEEADRVGLTEAMGKQDKGAVKDKMQRPPANK